MRFQVTVEFNEDELLALRDQVKDQKAAVRELYEAGNWDTSNLEATADFLEFRIIGRVTEKQT